MNFKKIKYTFSFIIFQIIFLILFSYSALAADVYTLKKTLEEPTSGLYFGQNVNAGDFNNDGYQDLAIPGKPTNAGSVYVYYGSDSGIGDTPNSTLTNIIDKASFGVGTIVRDLNNDDYDDLIIRANKYNSASTHLGRVYIYYGQEEYFSGSADFFYTGSVHSESFGTEVLLADLNGDSYPELIVSDQFDSNDKGRVRIWLGEDTISGEPDYTINGENDGDQFWYLGSGKFNQDDYYDLVVGAEGFEAGANKGKIYVYYGGASFDTTEDVTITGENDGNRFGHLDTADFNNDGYDELVVGAYGYNSFKGRVYIYYGPNGIDSSADVLIDTDNSLCFLGIGVGTSMYWIGKINNDDYNDLVLSCYSANTETGESYIHYGGENNIGTSPNLTLTGETTNSRFGMNTYGADLNNNGKEDLVISAGKYDSWTGRVYVFWGGAELNASAEQFMTGEAIDDVFASNKVAADLNNDGYKELVLAYNNRTSNEGKVYIYDLVTGSPSLEVHGPGYLNITNPSITGSITYTGINVGKVQIWNDNSGWTDCQASNGIFNSLNEDYYCSLSSLTQGAHTVRVRSNHADKVYLPSSVYGVADFKIDTTSPLLSELVITNAKIYSLSPGKVYTLTSAHRTPFFSGKASDAYQGSEVINDDGTKEIFDKVASGPDKLILNLKKLNSGENPFSTNPSYTNYLTEEYYFKEIHDTNNQEEKFSKFFFLPSYSLEDGYYQVNLSLQDKADNFYRHPAFYLTLNYQQPSLGGVPEEDLKPEAESTKEEATDEVGRTVSVKVVDEQGKPLKGVKVILYSEPRIAYTNEEGVVIFENIESGKHKIVVAQNNQQGEQEIELTEDSQEFKYILQIETKNPFFDYRVVFVFSLFALAILLLLLIIFILKKRS